MSPGVNHSVFPPLPQLGSGGCMEQEELAAWRALYAQAMRIRELAPWDWMGEGHILGVEVPASGVTAYVVVMGGLGRYLAVTACLGETALWRYLALLERAQEATAQDLLEIRHLQLSFQAKSGLEARDLSVIRALGLRCHGRRAWPCFRSVFPGCVPWFLEDEEIALMATVLEQFVVAASRTMDDPSRLLLKGDRILVRRRRADRWREDWQPLPEPSAVSIPVRLESDIVRTLDRQPHVRDAVEVDLVMLLGFPVQEPGQRPYFPYALLVVDPGSGEVLAFDLLSPLPSLEHMWGHVIPAVVGHMAASGFVPSCIRVRSALMEFLMGKVAELAGTSVQRTGSLPAVEAVLAEVDKYLRGRG